MNYKRTFDESNVNWFAGLESPAWRMFFTTTQSYANSILRVRGHIFLNEVYDSLGLSRTKEGQTVGWMLDIHNANHPNQVIFELVGDRDTNTIQIEFLGVENILDVLDSEAKLGETEIDDKTIPYHS